MINFILGILFGGTLLFIGYYRFFRKKKQLIDYTDNGQLERLLSQENCEFLLIDIRTEEEYRQGHLPRAVNIPVTILMSSLPAEDMFMAIIVYANSRKEALSVAAYLSESGYFNVTSFGAIDQWKGELITPKV